MASANKYSDFELIALLKQGDEAAFNEIYSRYSMLIFYRVNQMLRDEEASKDLVQDVFISIWNKSAAIREDANLAGYLYISARNKIFNLIKKGKVRSDYLSSLAKYASEVSTATMDELDEKDLLRLINEEIERLPVKMKEVFELSRKENLSHMEIAGRLGISDTTVKKQINRALRILRLRLGAVPPAGFLLFTLLRK